MGVRISKGLADKLAQAVCGDDHLMCSWPTCGCKSTKRKINAVALVVSEIVVGTEVTEFRAADEAEISD